MQKLVDFFFISGLDEEYAFDADCGRADKKALEVDTLRVSSRRTSVHESNASTSLDIPGEHSQQVPLRFIKNRQSRVFEDNDSFEAGVTTRATCTKITHGEKVQSLQASELCSRKSMYDFSPNEKSHEAIHMSSDSVVPRQPVLDQQPSIEPSQSHVRNGRRQSRRPIRQPSILSRKSSVSSALGPLRQELGDYVHCTCSVPSQVSCHTY